MFAGEIIVYLKGIATASHLIEINYRKKSRLQSREVHVEHSCTGESIDGKDNKHW